MCVCVGIFFGLSFGFSSFFLELVVIGGERRGRRRVTLEMED